MISGRTACARLVALALLVTGSQAARAADIKQIEMEFVSKSDSFKSNSSEGGEFYPVDSKTENETVRLELVKLGSRKLYALSFSPIGFGCSIDGQSMSVRPLIDVGGEYSKNFDCEFETTGTKIEVEINSSSTFSDNKVAVTGSMNIHGRNNPSDDEWWQTSFSFELFVLGSQCRLENFDLAYSHNTYKEWQDGLVTQFKTDLSTNSFSENCISDDGT